ncbi:MAG: hypothetical protein AB4368_00340 [Xenococcaceae cyanobacterium]
MGIPEPIDGSKFNFIPKNKEETNSKVVELKPQTEENKITYVTSCALAVEIVSYWLNHQKYPISISEAMMRLTSIKNRNFRDGVEETLDLVSYLKKTNDPKLGGLSNELTIRLSNLYRSHPLEIEDWKSRVDFLEFVEDYMERWYFTADSHKARFISCSVALKRNWKSLRLKLEQQFENSVLLLERASIYPAKEFILELEKVFRLFEAEYKELAKKFSAKEAAMARTYQRCSSVLKSPEEADREKLEESLAIAKSALLNIYKLKIDSEANWSIARTWKDMELNIQRYIEGLDQSANFLERVKAGLVIKGGTKEKTEILLPLLMDKIEHYLDLEKVKKKVEFSLGHSLLNWGRYGGITEQMVESALLKEVEPIARELCWNMHRKLNQEFET